MLANASNDAISGQPANYGRGILLDIKEVRGVLVRTRLCPRASLPGFGRCHTVIVVDACKWFFGLWLETVCSY